MKQLELNLNKRLLIVEMTGELDSANVFSWNNQHVEKICEGSDLTEDIAKGFLHQSIHTGLFAHYVKDIPVNTYCYKTAIEAFEAVIYAYGHHWGENPHRNKDSRFKTNDPVCFLGTNDCRHSSGKKEKYCQCYSYREAKSRTFNPEKCIICEIV